MDKFKRYLSILGYIDQSLNIYRTCILVDGTDNPPPFQPDPEPVETNTNTYNLPIILDVNSLNIEASGDYIKVSDKSRSINFYRAIFMFQTSLNDLCSVYPNECQRYNNSNIAEIVEMIRMQCHQPDHYYRNKFGYEACVIRRSFAIFVETGKLYEIKVKLQSKTNKAIIAQQLKEMIIKYDAM